MQVNKLTLTQLSKFVSLIFAASLTVGCLSLPTTSYNNKASAAITLSKYKTQKNSENFGIPANKLNGIYSGVYVCKNIPISFTLNLKVSAKGELLGTMQRSNLINQRGYPVSKVKISESMINGHYDEATSTLSFRMLTLNNQPHNAYYPRMHVLQGILLPDASSLVLYDTKHACSALIAKRGNDFPEEWNFLKKEAELNKRPNFMGKFSVRSERNDDRKKKSCDPKLLSWLKQSEKIPKEYVRHMYRDEYFVPYFGKPFLALDTTERMIYSIRLNGSCSRYNQTFRGKDPSTFRSSFHVIQSFDSRSHISDVDKAISLIGFNLTDNWFELSKKYYAQMAKQQSNPDIAIRFLKRSQFMTQRLLPNKQKKLITYAKVKIGDMIIPQLKRNLNVELATLSSSLASLNKLASFEKRSKKKYPDVNDNELQKIINKIRDKVNQSTAMAIKQYTAQMQGMDGIRSLDSWEQQYIYLVDMLSTSNKKKIVTSFSKRRTQIAGKILRDEKLAFKKNVVQQGATIKAVLASVRYETRFNQQYSMILYEPGFTKFASERQVVRNKILAGTKNQIIKLIKQTKHQRTFNEVEASYFLASDKELPAGKKILSAAETQRSKVAPFGKGKFEVYLNALYTYDYKRLRAIDRASITSIAAALQGMRSFLGNLTGKNSIVSKIMKVEQAKLRQSSLIHPIMAYYILNYEKNHNKCIEKTAVRMTVKHSWETYEVSGGFRTEIDSGSYDIHYKVNRRFLKAFNVIYKSDGDEVVKKFADRFFNGKNKIYRDELIDGTRNLMKMNCKGKIIKNIEPKMIRYFNDVQGRMDAISF